MVTTKVDEMPIHAKAYQPSIDDLQREYRYQLAHKIIINLLDKREITTEEYADLEHKFRQKYSPHFLEILPELTGLVPASERI